MDWWNPAESWKDPNASHWPSTTAVKQNRSKSTTKKKNEGKEEEEPKRINEMKSSAGQLEILKNPKRILQEVSGWTWRLLSSVTSISSCDWRRSRSTQALRNSCCVLATCATAWSFSVACFWASCNGNKWPSVWLGSCLVKRGFFTGILMAIGACPSDLSGSFRIFQDSY